MVGGLEQHEAGPRPAAETPLYREGSPVPDQSEAGRGQPAPHAQHPECRRPQDPGGRQLRAGADGQGDHGGHDSPARKIVQASVQVVVALLIEATCSKKLFIFVRI